MGAPGLPGVEGAPGVRGLKGDAGFPGEPGERGEPVSLGLFVWSLFVCWLVACRPSNMLVYPSNGSAQTILRAATLTWKLQIKLSTSPSHSILTPGRPVPALTL